MAWGANPRTPRTIRCSAHELGDSRLARLTPAPTSRPTNLHTQDPASPELWVLRFGRLPRIHRRLVNERAVSGSLPDRVLPQRARRSLSPLLWSIRCSTGSPSIAQLLASAHFQLRFPTTPSAQVLIAVVLALINSLAHRLLLSDVTRNCTSEFYSSFVTRIGATVRIVPHSRVL